MSDVKRYGTHGHDYEMDTDTDGADAFVRAADYEALQADLAEARSVIDRQNATYVEHVASLMSELSALRAECERLMANARRYEWLRNPQLDERGFDVGPFVGVRGPGGVSSFTEESADRLVDAAIDAHLSPPKDAQP